MYKMTQQIAKTETEKYKHCAENNFIIIFLLIVLKIQNQQMHHSSQ